MLFRLSDTNGKIRRPSNKNYNLKKGLMVEQTIKLI
jgi:hypothetical protein